MQKLIYINSRGQEIALSSSRPFLLEKFNPNDVNTRMTTSNVINGVSVDNVNLNNKIVPLEGSIISTDKQDADIKKAYLNSVFNPILGTGKLIYTNNNRTLKINCNVQTITYKERVAHMQKFQIQFILPVALWEEILEKREDVALWQSDLEFPVELVAEGIELGHRESSLICHILNEGDVPCGMRIQFKALASVVNPELKNINTNEYIKINQTLSNGDMIEVNTGDEKYMTLYKSDGTTENVLNWMDLESDFIQLELGDNILRYNAESGIDNLEVTIHYSPLYLGV